jgi:hypothetical protein
MSKDDVKLWKMSRDFTKKKKFPDDYHIPSPPSPTLYGLEKLKRKEKHDLRRA